MPMDWHDMFKNDISAMFGCPNSFFHVVYVTSIKANYKLILLMCCIHSFFVFHSVSCSFHTEVRRQCDLQQCVGRGLGRSRKVVHNHTRELTVLSWRLLCPAEAVGGEMLCPQVASDGKEEPFWFISHDPFLHCRVLIFKSVIFWTQTWFPLPSTQ